MCIRDRLWSGHSIESVTTDNPLVSVIGLQLNGQVDTLINNIGLTQQSVDLSSINASQYPYIQLQMQNTDTSNYTPYQLAYWRLTYDPAPEGLSLIHISEPTRLLSIS